MVKTVLGNSRRDGQRGIAVLTSALSFVVLLSILSLVLEVGWGYYLQRKAQTAVDAAAIAGLTSALVANGPDAEPSCDTVQCQAATACPSAGNLLSACQYAAANGVSVGANSQDVLTVASGIDNHAPNVPNVPVDYWVQVQAQSTSTQWFSRLFTSGPLKPYATATAGLRRTSVNASLYLLNRASDCFVSTLYIGLVCGEDFLALGSNSLNAGGGIYMSSSNGPGLGLPSIAAGTVVGAASVTAPFTYLMGNGSIQNVLGTNQWTSAPTNNLPDGDYFTDPFAGRAQPPVPTGLPDHPVPGGVIVGSLLGGSPTVLPPGNYYSTLLGLPTGIPVTITGAVVFSDGASKPCGGFCNYVFYGGVITASLSTVTFSPGRYVFAGAQPVGGGPGVGLSVGASAVIRDLTPLSGGVITQNTDAGEIFIFTDTNYPGLVLPNAISSLGMSFPQARAGLMAGVEPQITLHGLNASSTDLPASLKNYAPTLIWQDRANSSVKFTSNGLLDVSCGGICQNVLSVPGSQEMVVMASQNGSGAGTNLYGTIYGPRGSWLTILGVLPGDAVAGPLQVVTGALQMALNSSLNVNPLPNPPTRFVLGLIQ